MFLSSPPELTDGSVTTAKLADAAVTGIKVADEVRGTLIPYGSTAAQAVPNGQTWYLPTGWRGAGQTGGANQLFVQVPRAGVIRAIYAWLVSHDLVAAEVAKLGLQSGAGGGVLAEETAYTSASVNGDVYSRATSVAVAAGDTVVVTLSHTAAAARNIDLGGAILLEVD